MEFFEITENLKATPGEYIFHEPTKQVVMCGSFNRKRNQVKAFGQRGLFVDKIENFKKIQLNNKERKARASHGCAGCKK
jgi:hypothetical protein